MVFLVSEEISSKIYRSTTKPENHGIEVIDILQWVVQETFAAMQKSIPLWAVQGGTKTSHKLPMTRKR